MRDIVIFDLGGVLIRWDPRHLYRKLFPGDEAGMEAFLADVCTTDWNECQDAGRTFAAAEEEAIARHPDKADLIRAFGARFDEMIPGANEPVVPILAALKHRGTPLYALTNWSAETFPGAWRRFPFLTWFDGIVVSGHEGLIKPDHALFHRMFRRYAIDPARAVFIDDDPRNAAAASALGVHGIAYTSAEALRAELERLALL
jgi:2-haloacid dehalogenase